VYRHFDFSHKSGANTLVVNFHERGQKMKENQIRRRECKLKTLVVSSVFMMLGMLGSQSYGMEFVIPTEFNQSAETSGALHTIRVHALTAGATSVVISVPGNQGVTETLSAPGQYKDVKVPVGGRITTDKPVVAVKYDDASFQWNESLAGTGQNVSVSGAQYGLVVAAQNATQVSMDLGNGLEAFDLNTGSALLVNLGSGKTFSSSNDLLVFTFDADASKLESTYLIAPDAVSVETGSPCEKMYPYGGTYEISASVPMEDPNATP
jgi:hypothetical protein